MYRSMWLHIVAKLKPLATKPFKRNSRKVKARLQFISWYLIELYKRIKRYDLSQSNLKSHTGKLFMQGYF